MGLTFLTPEVAGSALPGRTVPVGFPVDSGAVYSVVPVRICTIWGSGPWRSRNSGWPTEKSSDVSKERRGSYQIRPSGGRRRRGLWRRGGPTLPGAFTLRALGLAPDPLKRELRPLPMVLFADGVGG